VLAGGRERIAPPGATRKITGRPEQMPKGALKHLAAGVALTLAACSPSAERPVEIPATGSITFAAAGDVLLAGPLDARAPGLAAVGSLLRGATLAFSNLDINLLGSEEQQLADVRPRPRPPFGDERTARLLRDLGVDLIGLANDHATDYGPEGLRSTARLLTVAGLLHAGTGNDLAAARAPVYARSSRRIALVAVSASSLPESRATLARTDIAGRPGLSPLRYAADITVDPATFATLSTSVSALNAGPPPGDRELTMFGTVIKKGDRTAVHFIVDADDERAVLEEIRKARASADTVIVSLHAHEPSNASAAPADFVRHFARSAIDAGAVLIVGHGPHRLRGIERYKDGAILYGLGNFIYQGKDIDYRAANMFDRGADLYEEAIGAGGAPSGEAPRDLNSDAWWEAAIVLATFDDGKLSGLRVEPIDLGVDRSLEERGVPTLATGERRAAILSRIAALSKPYGTTVETDGTVR